MHVRYTRCTSEEKSGCLLEEHAFLCVGSQYVVLLACLSLLLYFFQLELDQNIMQFGLYLSLEDMSSRIHRNRTLV